MNNHAKRIRRGKIRVRSKTIDRNYKVLYCPRRDAC